MDGYWSRRNGCRAWNFWGLPFSGDERNCGAHRTRTGLATPHRLPLRKLVLLLVMSAGAVTEGCTCSGDTGIAGVDLTDYEVTMWLFHCGPYDIDFGSVSAGDSFDETFAVRNYGFWVAEASNASDNKSGYDSDLVVRLNGFTSAGCSGEDEPFSVDGPFPTDLAADEEVVVTVTFNPLDAGDYECSIWPEWEVIREGYFVDRYVHMCTIGLRGNAVPADVAVPRCVVDPPPAPPFEYPKIDLGEITVGHEGWNSLAISNENPDEAAANRFFFEFSSPTDGCSFFGLAPEDSAGMIGPGADVKQIPVRFSPDDVGEFSCRRRLSTLTEPGGTEIENPCPDFVEWSGTGVPDPEPICALDPPTAIVEFGQVDVGGDRWATLTISNQNPLPIAANQFYYAFDEGSNDCAFFDFDPPDDGSGMIGAAGSKQVVTRFSPDEARQFQCVRSLSTLDAPGGTALENACEPEVTWIGSGVEPPPGAPTWAACSSETRTMDLHAVTGLSTDQVFIAGDEGVVLTPVGTASCQWQAIGTGFTEVDLRDLWVHEASGQMALWAAGNIPPDPGFFQETGAILFSQTVNQAGWSQIDEDDLQTFEAVWGSGFDDVYFAGLGVSTDFPNAKWYAGDPQNLEKFTISWSGMSAVTGMDGIGPNDVWAVLHESWNAVYRFSGGDPTQEWEDMTPPYAPISTTERRLDRLGGRVRRGVRRGRRRGRLPLRPATGAVVGPRVHRRTGRRFPWRLGEPHRHGLRGGGGPHDLRGSRRRARPVDPSYHPGHRGQGRRRVV